MALTGLLYAIEDQRVLAQRYLHDLSADNLHIFVRN